MIKRIKLPGWLIIIVVLFVAIGGINKLASASNQIKKTQTYSSQGESEEINKLNKEDVKKPIEEISEEKVISKYPKINLQTKTMETDEYTYSITRPETNSGTINQSIQNWIDDEKEFFLKEVENNKELWVDNMRAHLNIELETYQISDDFYSLAFELYSFVGGANGQTKIKIFNIDLKNNRSLHIDDILTINEENLGKIQEIVWKELQKNQELEPYLFQEGFQQSMQKSDDWEWSINREKFTLYWDEYAIAAGAAGPVKAEIPLRKMYLFLHEDVDTYLKMPKEQQLEKEKIIQQEQLKLDPDGKYIALTFDDGPSPKVTPRVLEILKKHEAKATFFMLGNQVDYYPDLARQVAKDGHEIASHSKSHPDLSKMSYQKIKEELDYTKNKIKEATGITPNLIRPPYGAYNDHVIRYAEENDDSIILWTLDTMDWKSRNAESVKRMVLNEASPGKIILMHDIHASTADALPSILTALAEKGYQFVTVSQLLEWKEENGVGPHF